MSVKKTGEREFLELGEVFRWVKAVAVFKEGGASVRVLMTGAHSPRSAVWVAVLR